MDLGSNLASGWGVDAWLWLLVPLGVYCACSLALFAFGRSDGPGFGGFFFRQISDSLRRLTGQPGWAMAGVLSGLLFLFILVVGFYWDVAWHIDNGRDVELFTPSHTMILVGLGGLVYSAFLTMGFATMERAPVGFRYGRAHVPWSAALLLLLGFGGMVAFPLDDLWHEAYGIDVTLWSPTHLLLVGGGALGTVAVFLMCAEARPLARPTAVGRAIVVVAGGTVLVALSAVQGEFDFGVPQFQALYLPVLIVVAAGMGLVFVRIALGPWGALKVVLVYLGLRGFIAFAVGGVLNHTVPRFPLYLASALAVEGAAAWVGTRSRLRFGLVAGALVGTAGLVGELAWVGLSGWGTGSMPPSMVVKVALLGPVAGVSAGLLGAGLGRAFAQTSGASADARPMPVWALAGAGLALVAVLAYPLPRNVGAVGVAIRTEVVGSEALGSEAGGSEAGGSEVLGSEVIVDVSVDPADAAGDAVAFVVSAWQGGGRVTAILQEIGPGMYRADRAVPVSGRWKTVVSLQRGDELMAAPVYMPADAEIGAPEVPLVAERTTPFVRNTDLLLREQHPGPVAPAVAAWSGLVGMLGVWVWLMAMTARSAGQAGLAGQGSGYGPTSFEARSLTPHGR